MRVKNYSPYLDVPLGVLFLVPLTVEVWRGTATRLNLGSLCLMAAMGVVYIVSGLIRWNTTFIRTDEDGITVYNRRFSNRPSTDVRWSDVARLVEASTKRIVLARADGRVVRVPLSSLWDRQIHQLIAIIKGKLGDDANNGAHGSLASSPP